MANSRPVACSPENRQFELPILCTKCNPKLAAVFKAKGDWCAGHGFPESVCPLCHPKRDGKPGGANSATDPAPADGVKVRLAGPDVARLVGIETVKAVERPASAAVVAPVRLVYDASRVASCNARAVGVVREIRVEVGARVSRGAILAVLESTTVGADRSRLAAARTRLEVAAFTLERERDLAAHGVSARKGVLAARQEWSAANAEQQALQAGLSAVGIASDGSSTYSLTAPIAGIVNRREVSIGQLVEPGRFLFEIVDTSSVWAEADILEADVGKVSIGQSVVVTFGSLPGREFTGRLSYLASEVEPRTRTVRGRVPLGNPEGSLRANMFGAARFLLDTRRSAVAVPRSALQRVAGVPFVFVRLAADRYETRRVKLAGEGFDPSCVELESGVRAGEPIVTIGSYQLKTETVKSSIGAGCCDKD